MPRFLCAIMYVCLVTHSVDAELLIIKKGKDKNGKEIFEEIPPIVSDFVLGYQWPTVIASKLTDMQKQELLSPIQAGSEEYGKAFPQEEFIQKKIRQFFKDQGNQYYVVFIPTTLYELFCIGLRMETQGEDTPLNNAVHASNKLGRISILSQLAQNKPRTEVMKDVFAVYNKINDIFFSSQESESAFLYVNNALTKYLFAKYPELLQSADGTQFSAYIEKMSSALATTYKDRIITLSAKGKSIDENSDTTTEQLVARLNNSVALDLILKTISFEYQARKRNEALVLRGAAFYPMQTTFGTKEEGKPSSAVKKAVIGSTFLQESSPDSSLEAQYANKNFHPYTVSFSNSLFAGIAYDQGACAFQYLMSFARVYPKKVRGVGYVLFINKKAYVNDGNDQLFFIPPLSTIAALFQGGEFFHARTTAAIATETEGIKPLGLQYKLTDPSEIILVKRDPLEHAAKFSEYLAKNAYIIQPGDPSNLTEEEKNFVEELTKNQVESAQFYRDVQTVAPAMRKAAERRKEQLKKRTQEARKVKNIAAVT